MYYVYYAERDVVNQKVILFSFELHHALMFILLFVFTVIYSLSVCHYFFESKVLNSAHHWDLSAARAGAALYTVGRSEPDAGAFPPHCCTHSLLHLVDTGRASQGGTLAVGSPWFTAATVMSCQAFIMQASPTSVLP